MESSFSLLGWTQRASQTRKDRAPGSLRSCSPMQILMGSQSLAPPCRPWPALVLPGLLALVISVSARSTPALGEAKALGPFLHLLTSGQRPL